MKELIKEESGYSLVESLVALSLLLVVLVPLTMFLIFIGGNTITKDKIVSFNHARNQMEQVIATESDSSYTFKADENWWIKTKVNKEQDLYTITVSAFKRDTLREPSIELETARLWYKN